MNMNDKKENTSAKDCKKYINVVMVEPGKLAVPCQLGTELEDMQKVVDGNIEMVHPDSDAVCYICNEEGKINGMKPNRAIYDEDGNMIEVIFGPFFICGDGGDEFISLTEDQIAKYTEKYRRPEVFVQINGAIKAIPYDPALAGKGGKGHE